MIGNAPGYHEDPQNCQDVPEDRCILAGDIGHQCEGDDDLECAGCGARYCEAALNEDGECATCVAEKAVAHAKAA